MVDFKFRKPFQLKKNPKQKTQSAQRVLGYFKTMCEELGVSCSAVIGFCMVGKSRGEPGQGVGLVLTLGNCRAGWALFPTDLLEQVGSEQTAKQLCIVHPDFNRYDYLLQFY